MASTERSTTQNMLSATQRRPPYCKMLLLQQTWQRNIQCFLRVQVRVFHSFSLMSVECRPPPLIHPSLPCIGDGEFERKRERDIGTERDRGR